MLEYRARLRNLWVEAGSPSYGELRAHADRIGRRLPTSTTADLLNGSRVPRWVTVETFVLACRRHAMRLRADAPVDVLDLTRWRADYDSLRSSDNKPCGGLLSWSVAEFPPDASGIHRAVASTGISVEAPSWLPRYVDRDHDTELRARLTAAASAGGGFVLITGGSCSGKTRSAWEAIRSGPFAGWRVVRPRDAAIVRHLVASEVLRPRSVVWLDELQRYLSVLDNGGLTYDDVQALWSGRAPVVVIGTLWPDLYDAIQTDGAGQGRVGDDARGVLRLAGGPVRVADRLSEAELPRAWRHARHDQRLADALADTGHGMTQALAGAPWLVQRWEQPGFPYTRCVLAAAAAARRLGVRGPLPAALLRAAARGYFADQRPAPAGWFRRALAEAQRPIRGAVSALVPERDPDDDEQAIGYTLVDYLAQHTVKGAGVEPVPSLTWEALANQVVEPEDLLGLAHSARQRLLYGLTERIYRRALELGSSQALTALVDLCEEQCRLDEAIELQREAAEDGFRSAHRRLVQMLADAGRLDDLRAMAAVGDDDARTALQRAEAAHKRSVDSADARPTDPDPICVLAEQRRYDELRALADGPRDTALASLTADSAFAKLARLLREDGRTDEAIALLRGRPPESDTFGYLACLLADLLLESGHVNEALEELRRHTLPWSCVPGHAVIGMTVAILVAFGRQAELRELAEQGCPEARYAWGQVLRDEGRIDEAAEHFHFAARFGLHQALDDLGLMLADHGRLSEAHEVLDSYRAYGIEIDYRQRLAYRLAEQDRADDLRRAITFGNPYAAQFLAVLRAVNEPPAKLARAAVSGDEYAARALSLLGNRGYLAHADELRQFGLTLDGGVALNPDASRTATPAIIKTPDKARLLFFADLA